MKKTAMCVILCMMLLVSGCRNFELGAEPRSKWVSEDSLVSLVIVNGNYATGMLRVHDKAIPIECHFGPAPSAFAVYVLPEASEDYIDDTTWLFQGKYNYNPNGKTITLYCEKDQIGLDVDQIVLYMD